MTLYNKRRNGEEINKEQSFTIPTTTPFYVRLEEVPLRFINTITYSGGILREQVCTENPANYRFVVDYDSGKITFNSNQANTVITVNYKGTGSVLWVEDLTSSADVIVTTLTYAEILALPLQDKPVGKVFYISDYGRLGVSDGTSIIM